ncbi:MAG TPA: biotin transporter BioY [Gemmatimonadales bacterium]|nr:biotin transporter BioY [Gemmatimonadales bacterium]
MAEPRRRLWLPTVAGGAAAVALAAQITFPLPGSPVPSTLQGPAVLLAGGLMGALAGAGSLILYLILGAFGMPVFAGGSAGLDRLLGPTGGYLLSFPLGAALAGRLGERHNWKRCIAAALSGMAVIQLCGLAWFEVKSSDAAMGLWQALHPLLIQDLLKVALVTLVLWLFQGTLRPAT